MLRAHPTCSRPHIASNPTPNLLMMTYTSSARIYCAAIGTQHAPFRAPSSPAPTSHQPASPQPPPLLKQAVAALFSAALVATPLGLCALPAAAITNEQLLFLEAWRAVDRAYVDKQFNGQNWFKVREDALKGKKMASKEATYGAIRDLLASLGDPFTRFLDPDQYANLRRNAAGAVTGVGVEVSFSAELGAGSPLVVLSPAPGGPAERAGVKPQDQILAIDGQPTSQLSLYAAGTLLQGPEGSLVTLTVKAHAGSGVKDFVLTRQPIAFNPVDSALCSTSGRFAPDAPATSKLGYIRIATFSKATTDKVRAALAELQAGGAQRFVLDVRNNGGGLFPSGVDVARMWIDKGEVVLIADSEGVRDIYEADGEAIERAAPLTVLVNRGTASASEVLAGALKDNKRAVIAGENTFGKGLIQTLVQLSDGSAVAVTVARYQTPAGVDINRIGITPDLAMSPEALAAVPLNSRDFCAYASTEAAPKLFG